MSTETLASQVPAWLADMSFCHIDDGSGVGSLCGEDGGPPTCEGYYDGEAICPSCGCPTCPRCAQLSALEDALGASA